MIDTAYRNSHFGRGTAAQPGYGSQWQKARAIFLGEHPLCCQCHDEGRVTPATVVDHIKPHKGDQTLFWDRKNWQPLCKPHHDSAKQSEERRGYRAGCDADGRPLDPNHPWRWPAPVRWPGSNLMHGGLAGDV